MTSNLRASVPFFSLQAGRWWIFLFLFFGLAFSLRVFSLGAESFWTDEAFSVSIGQQESVHDVLLGVGQTEAAPPGYYIVLHSWISLFGTSEWSVRFLSVLFSTLAIVVLFLLVQLLFNRKVALLASLFMATSMLQIQYAQEARLYALFTFLSLCSTYFFARWYLSASSLSLGNILNKSNFCSSYSLFLYGLSMLFSLYVNYMAFFLIVGYTLVLFSPKKLFTYWKKWLKVHVVIFVLFLPGLPLFFHQFQTLNTGLADSLLLKGVPSFLAGLGLFFFLLPVLCFTLLTVFFISKNRIQRLFPKLDKYFLISLFGIGLFYLYLSIKPLIFSGIPVIRVPITNSYFLIRHSFFLVPSWYVYLGYKVDQFWSSGRKWLALFVTVIILFFSATSLFYYYIQPTKVEWREATQFIFTQTGDEEPFILLDKGGFSNEFLLRYYAPSSFSLLKLTWSESRRDHQQIADDPLLKTLANKDEFWLILVRDPRTGVHFKTLLDEQFNHQNFRPFYQLEVYRYTSKNS